MGWGRNPIENRVPASLDFPLFTLFTTSYPAYKGFMMLVSAGMFVVLYLVLKRTRIGLIIRAALTHPNTVAMLGHNVPQVFTRVFAAGTGLAALAGVIGGFALLTAPNMAASLGPIVFVVVVVGGLGSLPAPSSPPCSSASPRPSRSPSTCPCSTSCAGLVSPWRRARLLRGGVDQDRPGRAHDPLPAPRARADRPAQGLLGTRET
jgi:hypothetical protein